MQMFSRDAGLMIEIVSATRSSQSEFREKSALGLSLQRLAHDGRLTSHISYENRRGIPEIFNARISARDSQEILIFMHDDVWIDDQFFVDRVLEGLNSFDVIGIAGNRRRVPHQPAWIYTVVNGEISRDAPEFLSGSVAHGSQPHGAITCFGPVPAECELLDGVFLATRRSTLTGHGILFDPRFDFHFYDMDFCRSAREKQLRLGTWPICLTHQSPGTFDSPAWRDRFKLYLEKWER